MSAWTPDRLAATTLRRQFPRIRGRGIAAIVELYRRLGPIQTQVPRSAHLALASRLPGVTRDSITAAFESYQVVKASNLRGTVHTSTAEQHPWLATAAAHARELLAVNHLKLTTVTPRELDAEIERFAGDRWRERAKIVAHLWEWLDARGAGHAAGAAGSTLADGVIWGCPWLIRRPRDTGWDRRTDVHHRSAAAVFGSTEGQSVSADDAIERLVLLHLGSYGPATRRDIAWWLGSPLTPVDRAVQRLGDRLVTHRGDPDPLLDLAEPPRGGGDPGARLLPEFDGLLLGYAPAGRTRFVDPAQLERLWRRENGQFHALVLQQGRIVGTWKITGAKITGTPGASVVTIAPLAGAGRLDVDELAAPLRAVEAALGVTVTDLRIDPAY